MDIKSFEGTLNIELLEFQETAKAMKEAREGSSKVSTSFLGIIIDLIQIGMTSTRAKECIAIFKVFIGSHLDKARCVRGDQQLG